MENVKFSYDYRSRIAGQLAIDDVAVPVRPPAGSPRDAGDLVAPVAELAIGDALDRARAVVAEKAGARLPVLAARLAIPRITADTAD
jgi:hypothetical protein